MKRTTHRRSNLLRSLLALGATAIVGVAGQAIAAPPAPAAAAEITCNLGGSFSVIAAEQGIACAGGGSEGSGYSGASPALSACRYGLDVTQLPDGFLDFMNLPETTTDFQEPAYLYESEYHGTMRHYLDPETFRGGWILIRTNSSTHEFNVTIANRLDPRNERVATFNCNESSTGPEVSSMPDIPLWDSLSPANPDVSAPAASPTTSNSIALTTAQSPLPGRPGEYLVRVNLSNSGSKSTFVDAALSLTGLSNVELLSAPHDTSCPVSGGRVVCTVPTVLTGSTTTLVFHVTKASPDVSGFAISLTNLGMAKMKISEALSGAYWRTIAFESRHLVTLP